MTGKERVQTTLRHEKADMLPLDYMFEDYRTACRFSDYYKMTQEELLDYLGCDIVYFNVMDEVQKFVYNPALMEYTLHNGFAVADQVDPGVVYDRWGIGWRTDHDGERPVDNVVIGSAEAVASFQAPDPYKEGQLHELQDNEKHYNSKGYAVAVGQYYGLFEKAWLLLGYENYMYMCYDELEAVEALLDKITDYRIGVSRQLVQHDIAFGHSGDDYGTQRGPIMSLEMWRTLYKPRLKKIWDIYKQAGLSVVHHSCGDCSVYVDDMVEIGLDALHPVQSASMDIDRLSKRYGNNLVFYGGIDCQNVLSHGTPEDVRKNVEHVVRTLSTHGNMVLAPINIMRDVSFENFEALVESVNKFRRMG